MSRNDFDSQYKLLHDLNKGLTYIEISAKHNIPIGTVKSRISRARNKLDKIYNEQMDKVFNHSCNGE